MRPKIATLLDKLSELKEKLIPISVPVSPDNSNTQDKKPVQIQIIDIPTDSG